jgi:hypothetical protein
MIDSLANWKAVTRLLITAILLAVLAIFFLIPLANRHTVASSHESAAKLMLATDQRRVVWSGDSPRLDVRFRIENHGNRRLIIHAWDDACGCHHVTSEPLIVPPRGKRDLVVSISPRPGTLSSRYTNRFTSNDPRHPRFDLTVQLVGDRENIP